MEEVEKVLTICGGEELVALEKLAELSGETKLKQDSVNKFRGRVSVLEVSFMLRSRYSRRSVTQF